MKENCKKVEMSKFCVFIFCWGRPKFNKTYQSLRRSGYTGRIIMLVDNLDSTQDEYIETYGKENVYVFDKILASKKCDPMDNFGGLESTLYVENSMFEIAKELGFDYFCSMCDDYYNLGHRGVCGAKKTNYMDLVFEHYIEYLINTPIKCVAFCQGGDSFGGFNENRLCKRKVMNSFICKTNSPFSFYGSMNDDVNMYVQNGIRGDIFLTTMFFQIDQMDTQSTGGGLEDLYRTYGTYVKSFYTVMLSPSSVKITLMGEKSKRLHHRINYNNTVPCIINEKHKKE